MQRVATSSARTHASALLAASACLASLLVSPGARSTPSAIRGVTVGPIESSLHPGKGYGSPAYERTLREVGRWGGNWVSLTPFGRTVDLTPTGVDLTFEAPFERNQKDVAQAVAMAHARGLRVLLVPHLWVENGNWRAEIDPGSDEGWRVWAEGYAHFLLTWARVAQEAGADMFSVGVELRSWVTTQRAPSFVDLIRRVRAVYGGPLTYSANWDDVDQTVILGELDVIGINAFYPLASEAGAEFDMLLKGSEKIAARVAELGAEWNRPVLFTELGYTTRPDPAIRPWEWPDSMRGVVVDEEAQATAYRALLAPLLAEPSFEGFFIWRVYADPDDVSQEAEWGFSPRGKRAELVVRDAFTAYFAADGEAEIGHELVRWGAKVPGVF